MDKQWTLPAALDLIKQIEEVCPACGCHVALTGGVLYKDGGRKDLDLLFYRVRQTMLNHEALEDALAQLGIIVTSKRGWLWKAKYFVRDIDIFFPEPRDASPQTNDEYS